MNQDLFNELADVCASVLGTLRSQKTFPSETSELLKTVTGLLNKLKYEEPRPSQEEFDSFVELQMRTEAFQKNLSSYGRDTTKAREGFKRGLAKLFKDFNDICANNPKYKSWLTKLPGYKKLAKMVAA